MPTSSSSTCWRWAAGPDAAAPGTVGCVLIAGAVLILIAVGAALYARSERGDARKATLTETMACGDVATLSQGVGDEVGAGSFAQRCEVVGKASAGPAGLLKGPESGLDAVWARSKVTHKYWVMEQSTVDGRTTRSRQEREETVSEQETEAAFAVDDGSGSVVVEPRGATIDSPEQVVDRFEPSTGDQGDDGLLARFLRSGGDSGTLGFTHEEWIIRPGTRLYVQGEVADRTGTLLFAEPQDGGSFLVSTRSEQQIVSGALKTAKIATAVGAVAGLLGVALVLAGLVV